MNRSLKSSKPARFLALCAGLALMAGQASAGVICGVTNTNAITNNGTVTVLSTTFSTTVLGQRVDVKYNAECSVAGVQTNWLNTDIIIDPAGTPLPFTCTPSNGDNALCSGNGTATQNDGWVSAVTNCVARMPTVGLHTVRVVVNPFPAGTTWRIDDQSLVCIN